MIFLCFASEFLRIPFCFAFSSVASRMKTILLFVLLNGIFEGHSMIPRTEPINTVTLLGSDAVLRCQRGSDQTTPVTWHFYDIWKRSQQENGVVLTKFGNIHSKFDKKFALNRTMEGQNDLRIRSVSPDDAGIYECVKSWGDQPSAHLSILNDPVCRVQNTFGDIGSVRSGDTIHLSCVLNLMGHCQPTMEWKLVDGTLLDRRVSIITDSNNRTVLSEIDFIVKSDRDSIEFVFSAWFLCPHKDLHFTNLSADIPEYEYNWRSSSLIIHDSSTGRTHNTLQDSTQKESHTTYEQTTRMPEFSTSGDMVLIKKDWIIYILLAVVVFLFVVGMIAWIARWKTRANEQGNTASSFYFKPANVPQESDYHEIDVPASIHTEGSLTRVICADGTLDRASDMVPGNTDGNKCRIDSSRSNNQTSYELESHPSRTSTLLNQTNENYIDLKSSTKAEPKSPSVYKRLDNVSRKKVQSSPVLTSEGVRDHLYVNIGNVNRPRLPTPESSNSSDTDINMDVCVM